jgi:hypothetical protein
MTRRNESVAALCRCYADETTFRQGPVLDSAKPSLYKTAPRNMMPTKLAPELSVADNNVGSTHIRC